MLAIGGWGVSGFGNGLRLRSQVHRYELRVGEFNVQGSTFRVQLPNAQRLNSPTPNVPTKKERPGDSQTLSKTQVLTT